MSTTIALSSTAKRDLILIASILIRFLLFQFDNVTEILGSRVEIVTPVTSFRRLTEGIYLFQNGVPPYDGGIFHQPPLLLPIFAYIPTILTPILYTCLDLVFAYLIQEITRIKQQLYKDCPRSDGDEGEIEPWVVAGCYLLNPLTIATCLSKSTVVFTNFAVVASVYYAMKGNRSYAMFGIAMATYLSLYPITMVALIILLLNQNMPGKSIAVHCIILFIGWLSGLIGLSYLLVGSWDFLSATYGFILLLSDLAPNIGLFWYFFIEMFDQFRNFFLVVFQLHTLIFAAPLTIKFRDHPLFAVFVLGGITAVFKSYPSIGDASLYIAFLPIYSEIVNYMRYSFLITNIFLYSSLLAPIFYHLWIYAGSGNANFFYAITLVYSIGNIVLLVDATYAMLRREFDVRNPELKGREVTQK
ncbi:993_t:CDS:2 [Paraglomus brasilianum]|uniref:993_t:CDS:1 n=1 Tax=Paraglomus brasilianum TaxID=144538 RepID=A0A9N9G9K9_9GLOM|nr:993_t:CDS:2 [Paraglomus brasilianum]